MTGYQRSAVLLLILALIPLASAQQGTRDAGKRLEGLFGKVRKWEKEEFAKAVRELRQRADDLKKFQCLAEAEQLKGTNAFSAAAQKLEQAVQEFERKPFERLTPAEALVYRDALLELGRVYALGGDQDQASKRALQAEQTHARLPPAARPRSFAGQLDAIRTALAVGLVLQACDRPTQAARRITDALQKCHTLPEPFNRPDRNPVLLQGLLVQSAIANSIGQPQEARPIAQQVLAVLRKRQRSAALPQEDLDRAVALLNLAQAQVGLGQGPAAMPLLREADLLLAKLAPRGALLQAEVYRTLAYLHLQRNESAQALENVTRALKHYQALFPQTLYPRSHPALILARTSLADLLNQFGRWDNETVGLSKTALEHARRFYPAPHEQKAQTLLTHGRSLRNAGRLREALECFTEAVAMARQLYPSADHPRGHQLIALGLLHLGGLQARLGQEAAARKTLAEARALYRDLYPGGHPHFSPVALYLGVLALRHQDRRAARQAFAEALESDLGQLQRWARTAAEAEALRFARLRQVSLHGYLAASRGDPEADAQAFAWVRSVKNVGTHLALSRRAALRLARQKSPELPHLQEQLRATCARLHPLLLGAREESSIRTLLAERDRLEAQLERHWPELRFRPVQDRSGPNDLAAQLPRGSAFIELVRYRDLAQRAAVVSRYAAFTVLPGKKPRRVELGLARPIDQTVHAWRKYVAGWDPRSPPAIQEDWERQSDACAARLRRLVWEPLARHLPSGTRLLYLAPDGDLTRFPFAALPGSDPRKILLEELTIATVPNGSFLLDGLLRRGGLPARPGRFLALGAVRYDPPGSVLNRPWPFLAGSLEGLEVARQHAAARPACLLRGPQATFTELCKSLAQVRHAHLSTHSFFAEQELTRERKQVEAYLVNWNLAADPPARGVGVGRRFPLSYTGLVLAGANDPKTAGPGGGILAGEVIAELDLDGLRLAVLSACDTGLGEYTAGEGVQGLQRAFHLAGCPNVIATLWKVRDRATQVLMREFYRQLWEKKLPTVEALRRAQLAIYRAPALVLGSDPLRGAPVGERQGGPVVPLPRAGRERRRAHVQLWGAFVHDGVGYPRLVPADLPEDEVPSPPADSTPRGTGEPPRGALPWPLFAGLAGLAVLGVGVAWWYRARFRLPGARPAAAAPKASVVIDPNTPGQPPAGR